VATGYVWLERYGWHDTGTHAGFLPSGPTIQPLGHFESPESKVRLASLVEVSGLVECLHRLQVTPASPQDLLRVHDPAYVERIKAASDQPHGGDTGDPGTAFGFGGYESACLAAGGTMAAVRHVLDGTVLNAYALVRPPGHHAEPGKGMGFCIFANIAIAIRWAREEMGTGRVAVIDWDVHHGNGTQKIFAADPETLTISIHQDNLYPFRSGLLTERGSGAGFGSAINIPLPAGSGNGAYLSAMAEVVLPAVRAFMPELIIVACGFDAAAYDPLGRMLVTVDGYRQMAASVMAVAAEVCQGRVIMSHEGGYSPSYAPFCGLAVIETMAEAETGVGDPFATGLDVLPDQELQPHQRAVIEAAAAFVPDVRPS
jgi:acetoin utilization deacetylase AcuC-like enzyme